MAIKVGKFDVELYREALQQLAVAMDQVDQAHATLKDLNLSWIRSGRAPYSVDIANIYDHLESIAGSLEKMDCDECGRAISGHPHADCKEWL
jgi:hypothetical protein